MVDERFDSEDPSSSTKKRKLPNWLASSDEIENVEKRKRECTSTSDIETNKENEQNSNINLGNNPTKTNADVTKELETGSEISKTIENFNESEKNIAIKEEITESREVIKIKTEPLDSDENSTINSVLLTQTSEIVSSTIKIKIETDESSGEGSSGTSENKTNGIPVATVQPLVVKKEQLVKKEPEAGSSVRPSCKFGIKCYRRNPFHRVEEAHPGDLDYRRPEYPEPPIGTPLCPFGNLCYRRNPVHFQQFSHPPQTDFQQNRLDRQNKLRDRKPVVYNAEYSDDDISSDDDFSVGSEDEYDPENVAERESSADEGVDLNEVSQELGDDNESEDE